MPARSLFSRNIFIISSRLLLIVLICVFLSGCAALKKAPPDIRATALKRLSSAAYPPFADDFGYDGLKHGIQQSLAYLQRIPSDRIISFGKDRYDTRHIIRSLELFLSFIETKPTHEDLTRFIHTKYRVYKAAGRPQSKKVLFTGYYEPLLQGRTQKNGAYRFPVYARPRDHTAVDLSLFYPDLKGKRIIGRYADQTLVPYYDRQAIETNAPLHGKAPVLAWVKDRVGLFFLHIQGSGKIALDNGKLINVHYHTTNGHPYRSIGRLLIEEGKIPRQEMSMQRIRAYLREYPHEVERILNYNPSYVFFKLEQDGPLGFINVKLTPGRSIALDYRIFPPAALCFIKTPIPIIDGSGEIHSWIDSNRFTLNQDTGGAIRGPGRADLFWGNGTYAEIAAGHMQQHGNLYFLVLKPQNK